jgi:hypothetical protein
VLDLNKQQENQTGVMEMELLRAVADYRRTDGARNEAIS